MGLISVEFLEPGMELSGDVRDANGMVLLGAGAVINKRHIGIFKSWGVAHVDIKGSEQDALSAGKLDLVTEEHRSAIERELDRMFQHNDMFDPVIEELRRICQRRELERVASEL